MNSAMPAKCSSQGSVQYRLKSKNCFNANECCRTGCVHSCCKYICNPSRRFATNSFPISKPKKNIWRGLVDVNIYVDEHKYTSQHKVGTRTRWPQVISLCRWVPCQWQRTEVVLSIGSLSPSILFSPKESRIKRFLIS